MTDPNVAVPDIHGTNVARGYKWYHPACIFIVNVLLQLSSYTDHSESLL